MDIQNIPQSVQAMMNQARGALSRAEQAEASGDWDAARDHAEYALSQLSQVSQALAASNPELAALVALNHRGYTGTVQTDNSEWQETTYNDYYLLGFRIGGSSQTVTRRNFATRRWDIY